MKRFIFGTVFGLLLAISFGLGAAANFYIGYNPATGLTGLPGALVDVSPTQVITGCSITNQKGGTTAGQFTAGATTCTISMTDAAAPNGYTCLFVDLTNPTTFREVATSTTGCTAVGTVTINDIIVYVMIGY